MNWIRLDAELFRDPRCARLPLQAKAVLVAMWQIGVEYGSPTFDGDDPMDVEVDADRLSMESVAAWCGASQGEIATCLSSIAAAGLVHANGSKATLVDLGSINAPYFKSRAYDSRRSGMRIRRNPPESAGHPPESVATGRDVTGHHETERNDTASPSPSAPAPGKAPRKKPDGDHAAVVSGFCDRFLAARSAPYAVQGAKDGAHVKALLGMGGVAEILVRAERMLADPWYADRGCDLGTLRGAWNKLAAKPPAKERTNGYASPSPHSEFGNGPVLDF